jgi:hypothetical protein
MTYINPDLPRVIHEALGAYAQHYFSEDQAFGSIVVKDQNEWIAAEKRLMKWLKRVHRNALEAAAKVCDTEVARDGYILPVAERIQAGIRELKTKL